MFRQASASAIIRNAHAVNLGQPPQLTNDQGDCFFLCRRDPERVVSTVVELCGSRLPEKMGVPADQIQVLTPTRKGPTGTISLNRRLQAALNPPAEDKRELQWGERLFREGDRIMQTRNDYDVVWEKADGTVGTGMFNGDVGKILKIDPSGEWLEVDFDGREAVYGAEQLSEIDLAYAQTVHKAQGSEYRCVVLSVMPAAPSLMVRGVLYTALTRAREGAADPGGGRCRRPGHGGQRPPAEAVFGAAVAAGHSEVRRQSAASVSGRGVRGMSLFPAGREGAQESPRGCAPHSLFVLPKRMRRSGRENR